MYDRVVAVCALLLAAAYFYGTAEIPAPQIGDPLGPRAFPLLLGIALVGAAGLLWLEQRKQRRDRPGGEGAALDGRSVRMVALVSAWIALYYAVLEQLGYVVATTVFLFALMAWFHRGQWLANTLASTLFALASYFLFLALDVALPRGVLPF